MRNTVVRNTVKWRAWTLPFMTAFFFQTLIFYDPLCVVCFNVYWCLLIAGHLNLTHHCMHSTYRHFGLNSVAILETKIVVAPCSFWCCRGVWPCVELIGKCKQLEGDSLLIESICSRRYHRVLSSTRLKKVDEVLEFISAIFMYMRFFLLAVIVGCPCYSYILACIGR